MNIPHVRYIGCDDWQAAFGGWDDPRQLLTEGAVYMVRAINVHSFWTDVTLYDVQGKRFNSVAFGMVADPDATPATPELLDALKGLVNARDAMMAIGRVGDMDPENMLAYARALDVFEAAEATARAVIAKAESGEVVV